MSDAQSNPHAEAATTGEGFWSSIWVETGKPLAQYLLHCITGTVLFMVIATAALGLHFVVKWMELKGFDGWRLTCLEVVEGGVLVIDAAAYLVFLCRVTWKMVKSLW